MRRIVHPDISKLGYAERVVQRRIRAFKSVDEGEARYFRFKSALADMTDYALRLRDAFGPEKGYGISRETFSRKYGSPLWVQGYGIKDEGFFRMSEEDNLRSVTDSYITTSAACAGHLASSFGKTLEADSMFLQAMEDSCRPVQIHSLYMFVDPGSHIPGGFSVAYRGILQRYILAKAIISRGEGLAKDLSARFGAELPSPSVVEAMREKGTVSLSHLSCGKDHGIVDKRFFPEEGGLDLASWPGGWASSVYEAASLGLSDALIELFEHQLSFGGFSPPYHVCPPRNTPAAILSAPLERALAILEGGFKGQVMPDPAPLVAVAGWPLLERIGKCLMPERMEDALRLVPEPIEKLDRLSIMISARASLPSIENRGSMISSVSLDQAASRLFNRIGAELAVDPMALRVVRNFAVGGDERAISLLRAMRHESLRHRTAYRIPRESRLSVALDKALIELPTGFDKDRVGYAIACGDYDERASSILIQHLAYEGFVPRDSLRAIRHAMHLNPDPEGARSQFLEAMRVMLRAVHAGADPEDSAIFFNALSSSGISCAASLMGLVYPDGGSSPTGGPKG